MRETKVSVAMATYNGERFLQEQLDSLARQTLLPHELVACDDGSTDGTLDVLHHFAAKATFPVRIYLNETRLGYRDNFMRAVELCEGDLVAFCDQDDAWLPNKLAACAEKFDSRRVAMVIHVALPVGRDLEPLGPVWPHLGPLPKGFSRILSPRHMDIAGMTMVFRRTVAEPLLRDSELRRAFSTHDHAMRFLAGAYGSVVPLREVLALHRRHEGNASGSHVAAATASAYIIAAKGLRGRLGAAARWLKTQSGLARATEWRSYSREAETLREKSDALRSAARRMDEPLRGSLQRTSTILSRRAKALADRSFLYRDTTRKGHMRFWRMLLSGRYGPRNLGGLGLWSLGKDFQRAFFSPGRPRASDRPSKEPRGGTTELDTGLL